MGERIPLLVLEACVSSQSNTLGFATPTRRARKTMTLRLTLNGLRLALLALILSIIVTPRPSAADTLGAFLRIVRVGGHDSLNAHRTAALEIRMLADFARDTRRRLKWIEVSTATELAHALRDGRGDLAIGRLPPAVEAAQEFDTTVAIATEQLQLIGPRDSQIHSPLDLAGHHIAVPLASPLHDYFQALQQVIPDLKVEILPPQFSRGEVLRRVAAGEYDAALLASENHARPVPRDLNLKMLFRATPKLSVHWHVPKHTPALRHELNAFIARHHAAYAEPSGKPRDFFAIKQRGVLRVGLRFDPQGYFLARGTPAGFDFELVEQFVKVHDLRLELVVGESEREMIRWLKRGGIDLVAGRLDSGLLHDEPTLSASPGYHYTAFAVVSSSTQALERLDELAGKTVATYEGSPAARALDTVRSRFPGVRIVTVDRSVALGALLDQITVGNLDATIIDGATLPLIAMRADLNIGPSLPHRLRHQWIVRGDNRSLEGAVAEFLDRARTDGRYTALAERYMRKAHPPGSISPITISPFDGLVQAYANIYDFDWRLIAAQMYQESRFDPIAISTAGAQGLMQVMPRTARSMGFAEVFTPEHGIHAGIKYLAYLRDAFESTVPTAERTWFALAAYNAGIARVKRARILTKEMDLDPNKWFGNVELAMLKMARGQATVVCACGQAIIYVRTIRALYGTYRQLELVTTPIDRGRFSPT